MTRDEAVALMKIQLGFRTDQTDNLVTALKGAQVLLERDATKPWFLLSDETTIATVADTRTIALPSDYLMLYEEGGLRYIPDDTGEDPLRLRKDKLNILEDWYLRSEGPPKAYSLDGEVLSIFPLPDDVYSITYRYFAQDEVLSTDVENQWLKYAPYLLMGVAGLQLAPALGNTTGTQVFTKWQTEGKIQLYRENEARMHVGETYQIGGPE